MTMQEYKEICKNFKFEIGSKYKHNLGDYEVLRIECDKLFVRFEDDSTRHLTLNLAQRSHLKRLLDEIVPEVPIRKHSVCFDTDKPFATSEYNEENFYWTLGALVRCIKLRAEIGGIKHIEKFIKRYSDILVSQVTLESLRSNSCILFPEQHKTGHELRMAIPAALYVDPKFCLPGIGHIEHSTKSKAKVRINNNNLIWFLVSHHNFRFSETQNYKQIENSIPERQLDNFHSGYSTIIRGA